MAVIIPSPDSIRKSHYGAWRSSFEELFSYSNATDRERLGVAMIRCLRNLHIRLRMKFMDRHAFTDFLIPEHELASWPAIIRYSGLPYEEYAPEEFSPKIDPSEREFPRCSTVAFGIRVGEIGVSIIPYWSPSDAAWVLGIGLGSIIKDYEIGRRVEDLLRERGWKQIDGGLANQRRMSPLGHVSN